jgi:hypothetical protein
MSGSPQPAAYSVQRTAYSAQPCTDVPGKKREIGLRYVWMNNNNKITVIFIKFFDQSAC